MIRMIIKDRDRSIKLFRKQNANQAMREGQAGQPDLQIRARFDVRRQAIRALVDSPQTPEVTS